MTPYLESVLGDRPLENVTYPHCDWRVLHAPGECTICDEYAAPWQQERIAANVLFTSDPRNAALIDHYLLTGKIEGDLRPCPAQLARGASCQYWGGNTPKP